MSQHITTIPEISILDQDGIPRVRDLDLAERLGFERPRAIRQLIERNRGELEAFGPLATQRGKSRGQDFIEFQLSEEQALLVATLSNAEYAPAVRAMLIRVFVAYRRGHLVSATPAFDAREARLQFRLGLTIAKLAGIEGNQRLISASNVAKVTTGVDYLASIGMKHLPAPAQDAAMTPTTIGQQLGGMSSQSVNQALSRHGYQTFFRDAKGKLVYEPTEKGRAAGGEMKDTGKRHGNGTPVTQLMWTSATLRALREDLQLEHA